MLYHVVAQPGSGLSRTTPVTSAPGWPAGTPRGRATSRRPRAGPAGARRWSTRWRAPAVAGLARAQALLARAIRPHDATVGEASTRPRPEPDADPKARAARSAAGRVDPPERAGDDRRGLSTVANAARLLKAFLTREESIGVSELARRLGLGKSTVHRLLTTLVTEGLVEQDPATGGYRLGLVMFELGEAVQVHMDLHAAAGPVLAAPARGDRRVLRRSACSTGTTSSTSTAWRRAHAAAVHRDRSAGACALHELRQGAAGDRAEPERERFLATACR